jgi:hypothetical protein
MSEEHSRLPLLFSQCQNFRMSCFSWQFCNLSVYLWWFGKSTTVLSPCCQAECKVEDRMIFQCTLYCSLLCVLFLQSRTTWDIQLRSWKSHHCWYSEATIFSLFFSFFFLVFLERKRRRWPGNNFHYPCLDECMRRRMVTLVRTVDLSTHSQNLDINYFASII